MTQDLEKVLMNIVNKIVEIDSYISQLQNEVIRLKERVKSLEEKPSP